MAKLYRALGLMSGTSLDAIDVAYIETDGDRHLKALAHESLALAPSLVADIRGFCARAASVTWAEDPQISTLTADITEAHRQAILNFRDKHLAGSCANIDLIGFHGQTVWHDPDHGVTVQLGDGQALADHFGVPVVDQFRLNDVAHGGQGAPLVPLFHAALCHTLPGAIAIINIGGVANVTLLTGGDVPSRDLRSYETDILAFDTGPGNALINDWMARGAGQAYDADGAQAAQGQVHRALLDRWLAHPYFSRLPPKSLDRNQFDVLRDCADLSLADGAATLTAFTVETIALALSAIAGLEHVIICGGGRHNPTLMAALQKQIAAPVRPCEDYGWDGDHLEAQAFGWLAVRSLLGAVISVPRTTGVLKPLSGGMMHLPS